MAGTGRAAPRSSRACRREPACAVVRAQRWCRGRRTDSAAATLPDRCRLPRLGLVIHHRQCDKENHGWREGLPLVLPAKFEPRPAFTLLHAPVSNEKKNNAPGAAPQVVSKDDW